ncbi:hypothetical protein EDB85DRAFT_2154357 [Lactarius pseudohatsudake]|nr:hypothetical protein EDB85DRAFT_2154357 [Lactarius pseudohatsudake]
MRYHRLPAAVLTFDEASTLWDILGYYHASGHVPVSPHQTVTKSATRIPVPDEDSDTLDEPEDAPSQAPDRRALQDALDSSNQLSGLDSQAQARLNECTYTAACLNFADQERIDSLPDEDPNTKAVLMQRVLEILMEVENLTLTEQVSVQDNLMNIGLHTTGISGQPSTLDSTLESESFSELSTLVCMRFKHQSEEEASSVHVAQTGSTQGLGKFYVHMNSMSFAIVSLRFQPIHIQAVAPTTYFASTRTRRQTPHRRSVKAAAGKPVTVLSSRAGHVTPSQLRGLYKTFAYVPTAADRNTLGVFGFRKDYPSKQI